VSSARPVSAPAPGLVAAWVRFWFSSIDPVGLHILRVLTGILFLVWLLPLAGQPDALFGLGGWYDLRAYEDTARLPMLPPHVFSWSIFYACGTDPTRIAVAYWLSVAVVALFTLGVWPRLTGVLTWVAAVSCTANPALAYDADPFLRMLAFYLMLGYLLVGQLRPGISLVKRLVGPGDCCVVHMLRPGPDVQGSVGANLALRLLQVHFALAMFASGLHKLQAQEWWTGLAFWFYVHPPFETTVAQLRLYGAEGPTYLSLLSLASYLALAWQIGFPAFAWRKGARPILVGGGLVACLADMFALRMPLMGPALLIGCLSYLSPAEWQRIVSVAACVPGLRRLCGRVPFAAGPIVPGTQRGVKGPAVPMGHR
jgi:hypothetical protein